MRKIALRIEYDGTAYSGWQRQENALAVQEVVERAVARLTGETAGLTGASRTDAGVHALGQVAAFDTGSRIPAEKFAFALNTKLPPDIRVSASWEAAADFHPRFMARGKIYRYRMYDGPHAMALYTNRAAHSIYPLDEAAMARCLDACVGEHDFAPFAASGSVVKDTVRTLYRCELRRTGRFVDLFVYGSGFLYNMVRILAGTLMDVGGGKQDENCIRRALETRSRLDLGVTAPACGLTLMRVLYDEDTDRAGELFDLCLTGVIA